MSKVIIIGGGISGMAAGILLSKAGYETEIFEKHSIPGGECTGWDRQGYHIDNCIQFMTGALKGSDLHEIWKEVGAIDDNTQMIKEAYFYGLDYKGKSLFLYTDLTKAQESLLEAAPEDGVEINRFFDAVKVLEAMQVPCKKPMPEMTIKDYIGMGKEMMPIGKALKEYSKEDTNDFAKRFHNETIGKLMSLYYQDIYMTSTLLVTYAFMSSGTGMIPVGGSRKMAMRMAQYYTSLGGILHTGTEVTKIRLNGSHIDGVELENSTFVKADYVIAATDPSVTFKKLLPVKYMPAKLAHLYHDKQKYRVSSSTQVMFGIKGEEETGLHSGSFLFECEPITVGTIRSSFMGVRYYDYDETLFPKGKTVVQVNYLQQEKDIKYWEDLYADKDSYKCKKQEFADAVKQRIEAQYPLLKDRLIQLDIVTPVSYERFCGAYQGAYMAFVPQKKAKSVYLKNTVKGIDNLVLAGQWLAPNGGLPYAVINGKFAAMKVMEQH